MAARRVFAEQLDQRQDPADEGEADRGGADDPGSPPRGFAEAQRDQDRAGQREEQDQPAPGGGAHPRRLRRSSTSSGSLRRKIATIRPRPTTTSQAATTITTRAKTWPWALPTSRLKATSARLPAFSISSRQSRITIGLRRTRMPIAPIVKSRALRTMYQSMFISELRGARCRVSDWPGRWPRPQL